MSEKKYIQSIERASEILKYIAVHKTVKLQEICQATGLKKTTAFGILQTLEHVGQVVRCSDGYTLGLESLNLGLAYLYGSGVTGKFHNLLLKIVEEVDETAFFGVKVGDKYYYLDSVVSTQALKVVPDDGQFFDFPDYSAIGQVFLNTDPDFTYAVDLEQVSKGLNCFAVPFRANGKTVGCIVLTGPSYRYTEEKIKETYDIYQKIMKDIGFEDHI
jgi:DNA-binding IclR family transcriptional regulator